MKCRFKIGSILAFVFSLSTLHAQTPFSKGKPDELLLCLQAGKIREIIRFNGFRSEKVRWNLLPAFMFSGLKHQENLRFWK